MNKGFTLVELLAVIVILGLISGIGIVAFSTLTARSESDYFVSLENNLELGASNYFANNRSARPTIDVVCSKVSLRTLVDAKYIDSATDNNGNTCDLENSYVYIKRNANREYEYKSALVCGDYITIFNETDYCINENVVTTTIQLSAIDENGSSYNVTSSYANTAWTSKNITVNFGSSDTVSKYIITNTTTSDVTECLAVNNLCSQTFTTQGAYYVESYNGETMVSSRNFNIKIDKTAPTFNLENSGNINIPYGSSSITYTNKVIDVSDESGIARTNFMIYKNDVLLVNDLVSGVSISSANLTSGRYKIRVKVYDKALNESLEIEQSFNISRSIKLIDTSDLTYDEVYNVVDGTNYNYLGTSLPVLNREGYRFLGWYTTSTGGSQVTDTQTVGTSIVALYARWE